MAAPCQRNPFGEPGRQGGGKVSQTRKSHVLETRGGARGASLPAVWPCSNHQTLLCLSFLPCTLPRMHLVGFCKGNVSDTEIAQKRPVPSMPARTVSDGDDDAGGRAPGGQGLTTQPRTALRGSWGRRHSAVLLADHPALGASSRRSRWAPSHRPTRRGPGTGLWRPGAPLSSPAPGLGTSVLLTCCLHLTLTEVSPLGMVWCWGCGGDKSLTLVMRGRETRSLRVTVWDDQ